jgi:hypothetical protein
MPPTQISFKPFEEIIMSASDFSFTREIRSGDRKLSCLVLLKSFWICSAVKVLYEGASIRLWKTRSFIWFWLWLIIQGMSCSSVSTRSHVSTNSSEILNSSEEVPALGLDEESIISSSCSCSTPYARFWTFLSRKSTFRMTSALKSSCSVISTPLLTSFVFSSSSRNDLLTSLWLYS